MGIESCQQMTGQLLSLLRPPRPSPLSPALAPSSLGFGFRVRGLRWQPPYLRVVVTRV